jgi:hypothetical protein
MLHAALASVSAVPALYGSSTMHCFSVVSRGSGDAAHTPRRKILSWSANRISAGLGQNQVQPVRTPKSGAWLQFAAICCPLQTNLQAHRSSARHRELVVVRPAPFEVQHLRSPLALFRFHYPRAYLTTSARPPTALDSLDSYQTLSNPHTNAIATRPGAAAVYPSARLADTEPPPARHACSLSRPSHFLALLCPSISSEGYGGRRWEIIA